MPILLLIKQLYILCIDFVIALPKSTKGNNALLIATNPLTKWVLAIIGYNTFIRKDWAS